MIKSFSDKETEKVFNGVYSKKLPQTIQQRAFEKLNLINAAHDIDFLKFPPSNCLEALKGNYKGFYSIRINLQWRIIFKWNNGAESVSIVDYH